MESGFSPRHWGKNEGMAVAFCPGVVEKSDYNIAGLQYWHRVVRQMYRRHRE